jgi:hypothetical protein
MAFTVTEFRDLVRILRMEPEWREELRRLVLTDELLALPQKFETLDAKVTSIATTQQQGQKEFAEFQAWTRERFDTVDERFNTNGSTIAPA